MSNDLHGHAPRSAEARFKRRSFSAAAKRASTSWFMRQTVLIVSAYFAYFLVRGFTEGGADQALANAGRVVDLERTLGFFWEPEWQAGILGSDFLVRLANSVYIYGHWPVIASVAVWLGLRHRSHYLLIRNAFLISGGIGLACFALVPTAPPRLVPGLEILDTVSMHSNAYRVLQPPALTNQYAAVPSLHLGWNVLIGLALYLQSPKLVFRAAGVLLPVAMSLAIVLTGNHFIFDAIAGVLVAFVGLGIALLMRRRGSLRAAYAEAVAS